MATNSPNDDDSTGVLNEVTQKTGVPREPLRATSPGDVAPEYPDEIVLEILPLDNHKAGVALKNQHSLDRCSLCPTAQALIRIFNIPAPKHYFLRVRRAYTMMPDGTGYQNPYKLMAAIRDYDNNGVPVIGVYKLTKIPITTPIDTEAEPWNDESEVEDD